MLILALLQAGALTSSAPPPLPSRFELSNGLRVWVQEDHSRPVALVQVTYKAGSINEVPGMTGIAHYVEHMVYRATKNIRNEDIYGYIDRIGGRYTGGTWPEFTRYAETVPAWAIESALRVTAERMCCALFDSTEFERERSNVVTEANGFADSDALSAMRDAVMYASFEVHPYRLSSNTWARDNLVLRRDDAFAWYKRYYGPNNAVLVVVGDVLTTDVRRLVERHFGAIARAPDDGRVRIVEPPQRVEKQLTLRSPGVQAHLEMVYRAPNAAHPDYATLAVLRQILSRRLGRMGIGNASTEALLADSASEYPYVFRIRATGNSRGEIDRVRARVEAEIADLGRNGVSLAEIATTRGPRVAPSRADREGEGEGQSPSVPPRRSNLTRVADSLSDRESTPWEVSSQLRDSIARRRAAVTSADIKRYVDRWLQPSQRTVGLLLPGKDDFVPTWSDNRSLAGARMEVSPLSTPPAKRMRPEAVPSRALEPLAPLALVRARRVLPNGVVIRVARVPGGEGAGGRAAVHLRADSGAASGSGGHSDLQRTIPVSEIRPALQRMAREARERKMFGTLAVAIAAPQDTSEMLNTAARVFDELPRPAVVRARSDSASSAVVDSMYPAPGQTQVSISARLPGVPRGHPDRRALGLLNYIVGVPSYGGRLGWALTKTGLTYTAAARTTFAAARGDIALSTVADTRNAAAAIQAIREVVAGIGEDGVEEWELREAQAFTLGRALLYGARDDSAPSAIANALLDSETADVELLDLPVFSRAHLAVTLEEINRVARVYYRPRLLSIKASGAVPAATGSQIFPAGTFKAIFEP